MHPLGYHILAALAADRQPADGDGDAVDTKGRFGKYENRAPDYSRSQDLPQFVREYLPEVVRREFAVTPPETPEDQQPIGQSDYQQFWLRQVDGQWDIYDIAEAMAATFDINPGWAFKSTRQHLNQLILQARMRGYRQDRLAGRRFRWGGPEPKHPACQWIRKQIPPEGLPYHEIVELMGKAKRRFVDDPPSTPHAVHDWCRHYLVEVQ